MEPGVVLMNVGFLLRVSGTDVGGAIVLVGFKALYVDGCGGTVDMIERGHSSDSTTMKR